MAFRMAAIFISVFCFVQVRSEHIHRHGQRPRELVVEADGTASLLEVQGPGAYYVEFKDDHQPTVVQKDDFSTTIRESVVGSTPTGKLQLGTPPKHLNMIFDTGSDKLVAKTWHSIKKAIERIDSGVSELVHPSDKLYNNNASSTYKQTMQLQNSTNGSSKQVAAQGFIAYGSGMAYTAEGTDAVLVGGNASSGAAGVIDFPISEISMDSLQVLHSSKGVAGILGLQHMKNKSLGTSLYSRLRESKVLSAFGYCRDKGNNGTWIWGDNSSEGTEMEVIGQMHWAIEISDVMLGQLKANKSNTTNNEADQKETSDSSTHEKTDENETSNTTKDEKDGKNTVEQEEEKDGEKKHHRRKHDKHKDLPESKDWTKEGSDSSSKSLLEKKFDADIEDPLDQLKQALENLRKAKIGGFSPPDSPSHRWQVPDKSEEKSADKVEVQTCSGDSKCVAVIDTGSNIIAMPSATIQNLTKVLDVKQDCSNLDSLPDLQFMVGGKMPITIPASAYVMKVTLPSFGGSGGDNSESGGDSSASSDGSAGAGGGMGGGGMGGGDMGDASGSGGSFKESLLEKDSKVKDEKSLAELRQAAALDRIRRHYGLDLRMILHSKALSEVFSSATPTSMCMLALVPIDRMTQKGALWVVGGPLFEKYYTRWSWADNTTTPKVFMKELEKATVCGASNSTEPFSSDADSGNTSKKASNGVDFKVLESDHKSDQSVIRSEEGVKAKKHHHHHKRSHKAKEESKESLLEMPVKPQMPLEPREMKLEEIRYPHWATVLQEL
mmetsp:Transcript_32681/g.59387  ORF Transcript_32681/g.59387 Transcript_32681/m.59387 type:complete len:777 (-) Transcript_32681:200-2530(-)